MGFMSSSPPARMSGAQGMVFAPTLMVETLHPMHSILVRGLWFHIITTDKPMPELDSACCVRSNRKVLHTADCTETSDFGRSVCGLRVCQRGSGRLGSGFLKMC